MNYYQYLTEEILPYWIKISQDMDCGAVFTEFDNNGNVISTDKKIWFLGRALWTYSVAYRLCEKKKEYLDICEHIFKFFDKCTMPGYRLPFYCDRDGNAKAIREVYYYSEMFAAMGCAQYYRICKKPEVWELAKNFFDTVYDLYKKNRYTTQEINVEIPCKTFGLHMAMLATAQFMRNVGINTELYDEAATMAVDELMSGGYVDCNKKEITEYVSLSGEKLPSPLGTVSCPGHIYEAAWFVMCEGEVKDDDAVRCFGRTLLESAMTEGFEKETCVIPTARDVTKKLSAELGDEYLVWPQQEMIVAFRLAYNIFGDKRYLDISENAEKLLFEYFDEFGFGLWNSCMTYKNGKFIFPENGGKHICGPFHFERILLALGALQNDGNILGYME